jgi:hypothetical protein
MPDITVVPRSSAKLCMAKDEQSCKPASHLLAKPFATIGSVARDVLYGSRCEWRPRRPGRAAYHYSQYAQCLIARSHKETACNFSCSRCTGEWARSRQSTRLVSRRILRADASSLVVPFGKGAVAQIEVHCQLKLAIKDSKEEALRSAQARSGRCLWKRKDSDEFSHCH